MSTDYPSRMRIPAGGLSSIELRCAEGELLARGYTRIVFGGRGPYVELSHEQVVWDAFQEIDLPHHYYVECRSNASRVKLYAQLHRVDYTDYLPGMCYVSPFDLSSHDGPCISRER